MEARTIKFKVWNIAEQTWVADGEPMDLYYSARCNAFMFDNDNYDLPENIALMQFTGLHDKNGKEIYEGDIVEYQYLNTKAKEIRKSEVQLMSLGDGINRDIKAYFPFCYTISGSYKEDNREVVESFITPANACEIIGNIYENPELIKQDGQA